MNASTLLLGSAICATWARPFALSPRLSLPAWVPLFFMATLAAVIERQVDAKGVLAIAAMSATAFGSKTARSVALRRLFAVVTVGFAFEFAVRAIPGFGECMLIDNVVISAGAPPTSISAYFDPGTAGLFLLALYCPRTWPLSGLKPFVGRILLLCALTTSIVLGLGVAVGYVRFELRAPPAVTLLYLFKIFFWTAILEEAFFRGVIQEQMTRFLERHASSRFLWVAPAVSAVLFGAAHLHGGVVLAALATLAGLGYAALYQSVRHIEAPIIGHFLLDATHFLLFTYPYLAP